MTNQLFTLCGVIVSLILIIAFYTFEPKQDPNEVFGDDFHGYLVYSYVNPDRKREPELVKKLIWEFENKVAAYISSKLLDLNYCHDEVMENLHEYRRYYKFKLNENSESVQVIFTFIHPGMEELYPIEEDPSFMDGGITQFNVGYDFENKMFTDFWPNYGGYNCLGL